jgi:hypothetical protein
MPSGITQGTFGYAKIGSTVILLRPGASLTQPINPEIPAPLNGYGGYGPMNYSMGLQFPQANLPCVPLDAGAAGWLSAANLNSWFITRSARPVWDLGAITTFVFSENGSVGNSQGVFNATGMKGAGFTISGRKGQGVAIMMRFAGVSVAPETNSANLPSAGLAGAPLSFNRISVGGASLASMGVTGFTLQFDTGLTPNMELDGTYHPLEQNGGTPSASLTLECNALDTIAPPGWNPTTNRQIELTDQTISILLVDNAGVGDVTMTITMKRLYIRDPRNRQGTAGRASRTYTYDLLATTGAQPIAIA